MAEGEKRVELIASPVEQASRIQWTGIGLLASLVVGYRPLSDAIRGNGPFTDALFRFGLCVAFSLVAALVLARLLDGAPPEESGDAGGEGIERPDVGSTFEPVPNDVTQAG